MMLALYYLIKLIDSRTLTMPSKGMVDGSNLPPCKVESINQVQRTTYISNICSHADEKMPITMIPEQNDWQLIDG